MKTKSKRPSAPAQRSRGQQRARARLLHPRAGRRCTPRSRAPPMPRRRRRPFYSMGFARSAGALDIICAAREASGSGVWRRLTRGRAQACVAWRRRAGAGREYRGAPGSARCLRAHRRERANTRYRPISDSRPDIVDSSSSNQVVAQRFNTHILYRATGTQHTTTYFTNQKKNHRIVPSSSYNTSI